MTTPALDIREAWHRMLDELFTARLLYGSSPYAVSLAEQAVCSFQDLTDRRIAKITGKHPALNDSNWLIGYGLSHLSGKHSPESCAAAAKVRSQRYNLPSQAPNSDFPGKTPG